MRCSHKTEALERSAGKLVEPRIGVQAQNNQDIGPQNPLWTLHKVYGSVLYDIGAASRSGSVLLFGRHRGLEKPIMA